MCWIPITVRIFIPGVWPGPGYLKLPPPSTGFVPFGLFLPIREKEGRLNHEGLHVRVEITPVQNLIFPGSRAETPEKLFLTVYLTLFTVFLNNSLSHMFLMSIFPQSEPSLETRVSAVVSESVG